MSRMNHLGDYGLIAVEVRDRQPMHDESASVRKCCPWRKVAHVRSDENAQVLITFPHSRGLHREMRAIGTSDQCDVLVNRRLALSFHEVSAGPHPSETAGQGVVDLV
ncbi:MULTISPECIES: hypothetical protein [Brevibacterium]|nr:MULTISPECIES: hypothetical protein [Brevibacterium]MDN5773251.1 hypothetical protein [Brevibacterium aurantiacum]WCE38839.1 hypothetical protein PGC08_12565 [Brevibacterium sp. BDJS002]